VKEKEGEGRDGIGRGIKVWEGKEREEREERADWKGSTI